MCQHLLAFAAPKRSQLADIQAMFTQFNISEVSRGVFGSKYERRPPFSLVASLTRTPFSLTGLQSGRLTRAELVLGLTEAGCSVSEMDDMFRKHSEGKARTPPSPVIVSAPPHSRPPRPCASSHARAASALPFALARPRLRFSCPQEYLTVEDFVDALAGAFTYKHPQEVGLSRYTSIDITPSKTKKFGSLCKLFRS